jgi:hypothetical protein
MKRSATSGLVFVDTPVSSLAASRWGESRFIVNHSFSFLVKWTKTEHLRLQCAGKSLKQHHFCAKRLFSHLYALRRGEVGRADAAKFPA